MRILLDTNILIHREARRVIRDDIGILFRWIDQLHHTKCIHPASIDEIKTHADPEVVRTFTAKLASYTQLKTTAPDSPEIANLRLTDRTRNDAIDTSLLAELAAGRIDILISEDRGIHLKAGVLGLAPYVHTIDTYLEKVIAENPELADYRVLSVRKAYFGDIDVADSLFDSFRVDYPGFDAWFNKKADEIAYVCTADDGHVIAFLYLKREGTTEDYSDISPRMTPDTRLKIGTFKVISNGYKLGERFLKIVFDNALRYGVNQIYVTTYVRTADQERLVRLLGEWGFVRFGTKAGTMASEEVLVRDFTPHIDSADPRRSYPFISRAAHKFIVPIWPDYHTELLPDSILRTESPMDFTESKPNRNAISKVYISRSIERGLATGDIIVFYRTGSTSAPAHHTAVATTIGVVQEVMTGIADKQEFINLCRKRSVFSDTDLAEHWDWKPNYRPFVVNFLYVHSFPKRPNLIQLKAAGVIAGAPRGFERIQERSFEKLLEISDADQRLIVG